jgi:hypothetical protein
MARTIELTATAVRVLRRECKREIENASQERSLFMRKADSSDEVKERSDEVERQEVNLLAAADLFGALMWARVNQGTRDSLAAVHLTEQAENWLRRVHDDGQRHLDYCATNAESDYGYITKEAYLVDVVGRILEAPAGNSA